MQTSPPTRHGRFGVSRRINVDGPLAAAAQDVLKAMVMIEDEIPRGLNELSGRHRCIGCLADLPAQEYFANDFMCTGCAETSGEYPLASTPGGVTSGPGPAERKDGGNS